MAGQYFSAEPTSKDVRRTLNMTLRGHEVAAQASDGVLSGSRVGLGTSVLLKHVPEPPFTGDFLDLDCDWGPIALTLALESSEANVWAADVSERVVDLTHVNTQANGHASIRTVQVNESSTPPPAGSQSALCEAMPSNLAFDVVWSNPPIRVGKEALHILLMAWLPKLKAGGAAYLVVQKNLGSSSLIPWLSDTPGEGLTVSKYANSKSFRIIEVRHEIWVSHRTSCTCHA